MNRYLTCKIPPATLLALATIALAALSACGGGNTAAPFNASSAIPSVPATVAVSINPAPVPLDAGGSWTFTATVTGTSNNAVTWSVKEGAAGGSITSAGVYSAPQTPGTYHVIATSQADTTKQATAIVTVVQASTAITQTGSMNRVFGIHTATLLADGRVLMAGGSGGYTSDFSDAGQPDAELYDSVAHVFTATGSMTSPRDWHTATLLLNGKVLVTGGLGEGLDQPPTLSSAEVYDPVTGRFAAAGNMSTVRAAHTATLLPDGNVLIAGGGGSGGFGFPSFDPAFATAEVYDPATNSFAATGAMGVARFAHTATRLPNGKVLITGGFAAAPVPRTTVSGALSTAELYDPATGVFTPTGSMGLARGGHSATLLLNGKVLVAGGIVSLGYLPYSQDASLCTGSPDTSVTLTAELYDPATGAFMPTGDMTATREEHSATLLPDGKVLILGGATASLGVLNTAEIYDPATGSFTGTASIGTPRTAHTATLLTDGTVLFSGGNFSGGRVDTICEYGLGSAEIYKELP